MTESVVRNLIDLYKFNLKLTNKGINTFWKITFTLTVSLTIVITSFILLCTNPKVDPCRWDSTSVDVNLRNQIALTITFAISATFILAGYRMNKLAENTRDQYGKCETIKSKFSSEIEKIKNEFEKENNKSSQYDDSFENSISDLKNILDVIEDGDNSISSTLNGLMNIVPKISYGIGIITVIVSLALKFSITISF